MKSLTTNQLTNLTKKLNGKRNSNKPRKLTTKERKMREEEMLNNTK